jgi:spermidine/putrescine transport system substrate-binding protein
MSESNEQPDVDAIQALMKRRLTRRGFLRTTGVGVVGGLTIPALLAACSGATGTNRAWDVSKIFSGQPGKNIMFANWPLYIDVAKKNGKTYYPSLTAFTQHTGIQVTYREAIQDNPDFFGKIEPLLMNHHPIGWDLIVMSNGWEFWVLKERGWVYPLDTSKRPTFDQYAVDWAKNPNYDPGARHSMAYQWGLTSLCVNHDLVSGPVTFADLTNPKKLPQASVGMLVDDMKDFVMKNLGIDPLTSGPAEWKEAAAWLLKQRDTGLVRAYYSQGYTDDLTAGNLSVSMAWSGDVVYYNVWGGYPNLEFFVPAGGCCMWVDNMMIPAYAANPVGALELMDWFYRPDIATGLQEYVMYMSPDTATKAGFLADAQTAEANGQKGYANKLTASAKNEFLFPPPALMNQVSWMRQLETQEEKNEWDAIFEPISEH